MKIVRCPVDDTINWNAEDLLPHYAVCAVIKGPNPGEVLIQNHTKLKKWTIPVGKAKLTEDSIEVLKRELREECGIEATDIQYLGEETIISTRNGKDMYIVVKLFMVHEYSGEIQNLEPHKHSIQKFVNTKDIDPNTASHALKQWLNYKPS